MSCFIIEDDVIQAESLKQMIIEISKEINLDLKTVYSDKKIEEILSKRYFSKEKNIYFVDIEIKGDKTKGFAYAKQIREEDKDSVIVFVSNYYDLAPESYKYFVSALSFIEKSPNRQKFKHEIKQCLQLYQKEIDAPEDQDYFIFKNKVSTIKVLFHDILYFTTAGDHKIKLTNIQRSVIFFGNLKQVETLDKRLIRVHQSFIVSKEKVKYFDKISRQITMTNGDEIPVSRRLLKKVDQLFAK